MIIDSGVVTGSLQVSGSLTVTGSLTVNGPITGAITGSVTSASYANFAETAGTASYVASAVSASRATSALNADTASYVLSAVSASRAVSSATADAATTASYAVNASTAVSASHAAFATSASHAITANQATGAITASHALNAANADNATLFNSLSSSQFPQLVQSNTFTGNNTFAGTQYISNQTNPTNFVSTAALYTDGGLRVTKDAFISGGLSIGGNLTVFGTSSINYITSSVLLGLEFLNLNTDLPALRYAGINIGDSGSAAGLSSSFWYDSSKDNWLYVYSPAAGAQQTSSLAINGPITYNNVGSEQGLLGNYVVKSQLITAENNHHITSSQIFDDGTTVAIAGNLQVTGSFRAANLTGSLNGSNLIAGSVANDRLTNTGVTFNGSTVALGGSATITANTTNTLTIGTGLSGTSFNGSGAVTIANTGVLSITTNTGLSTNASATGAVTITNTGVTSITAGTGITRDVSTGGVTITNSGVTSNVAGTGISVSGGTGAVTITNTGVTSAVAGTGVGVSAGTGAVTFSIGQAVATSSNVQFNSLGVGTAGSATAGEIRATNDITAFYSSDERLKENITLIENPIEKLMAINGVTFNWKEGFDEVHSHKGADTGVIAQQIEAIGLPETVTTRENGFKAVKYEKLNALLIEGFKAQQKEINELRALVNTLLNK